MASIRAIAPCNKDDGFKTAYLHASAKHQNFSVELIGLNLPFLMTDKLSHFRDYLRRTDAEIVVFTDAFDVFYTTGLEEIREKFLAFNTDIVISVERMYSHQIEGDRKFFETLNRTRSPYMFLNSGGIIGYRQPLLNLLEDVLTADRNEFFSQGGKPNDDQALLSYTVVRRWANHRICLDYNCDIFYLPVTDWDNLDAHIGPDFTLKVTGRRPCIVHVPWKARYLHILDALYRRIYGTGPLTPMAAIEGKIYTWGNHRILFLKGGRMRAFGEGQYKAIDDLRVEAFFGERSHILKFDPTFTTYISVRKDDYDIVVGRVETSDGVGSAADAESHAYTQDTSEDSGPCEY